MESPAFLGQLNMCQVAFWHEQYNGNAEVERGVSMKLVAWPLRGTLGGEVWKRGWCWIRKVAEAYHRPLWDDLRPSCTPAQMPNKRMPCLVPASIDRNLNIGPDLIFQVPICCSLPSQGGHHRPSDDFSLSLPAVSASCLTTVCFTDLHVQCGFRPAATSITHSRACANLPSDPSRTMVNCHVARRSCWDGFQSGFVGGQASPWKHESTRFLPSSCPSIRRRPSRLRFQRAKWSATTSISHDLQLAGFTRVRLAIQGLPIHSSFRRMG